MATRVFGHSGVWPWYQYNYGTSAGHVAVDYGYEAADADFPHFSKHGCQRREKFRRHTLDAANHCTDSIFLVDTESRHCAGCWTAPGNCFGADSCDGMNAAIPDGRSSLCGDFQIRLEVPLDAWKKNENSWSPWVRSSQRGSDTKWR